MKNILLLLSFMLIAGMGYSQLKVIPSGTVETSGRLHVGTESGSSTSIVTIGSGRTLPGPAAFTLHNDPGTFKFAFILGTNDACRLNYRGNFLSSLGNVTNTPLYLRTRNLDRVIINGNGRVDILGAATVNGGIAVTSDRRLKKNIKDYHSGLDAVLGMRPVTYQYNGKAWTQDDGEKFIGLVAQELQEVAPELVSDHTVKLTLEDDSFEEHTYFKIHDSELKYTLVNAIQEQQEIIDIQNEKIESLTEEIQAIKDLLADNNQSLDIEGSDEARLEQNSPNPFGDVTSIKYVVPEGTKDARIEVYNVNGQVINSIVLPNMGKGNVDINNKNLSSGQYF